MHLSVKKWMVSRLPGLGWIICTLAALFYCYEYLLRIEPSVMVEPLMREFDVTAGGLGLLVAMYYYAYTPLQAIVGVLTDYLGSRKVLMMAIACCAIGALIFGHTSHVYVAAFGRLLIGAGSAFAFVGVLKLASVWLKPQYFAIFAGIATSLGMLGGMFGDVELSKMVQHYGWHQMMMVSVIAGVFLLVLFWLFVHNNRGDEKIHVRKRQSWGYFVRGFFRMFASSQLWLVGLIGCILYTSLTVIAEMWGIPYLSTITDHNRMLAAHLNSMIFFGWLVGSPLMGWISNRMRSRKRPMILGAILSGAMIVIILWVQPQSHALLATLLFLFGVFSSAEILVFVVARESVHHDLVATAIGFVNLLVMLGGMLIQPAVGRLLDWSWEGAVHDGVHVYSIAGYQHALLVVPVLLLVAVVFGLCLRESYGRG